MKFDGNYWTKRYENGQTQWDVGAATPPITGYFDQVAKKQARILIPGAGNSYEGAYLHQQGFNQVFLLELSPLPLDNFRNLCPDFPDEHLLLGDFFEHETQYDYIVEQTFFCAMPRSHRPAYAQQAHALLKSKGKLVGVLFDDPLNDTHPPFGGHPEEYRTYFAPYFHFKYFERCFNSIPPRQGREWFICLEKR